MTGSHRRTRKELRRFGLSFGCAFGIMGGLLLWRGKEAGPWVLGFAVLVALAGLAAPQILRPLEKVLATLLRVVMAVITYVVLFVAFFLIITPMGILLRLMGKDLLAMKLPSDEPSYWVPVEVDGPSTRPDKPY
jgi:hypothetical protein